MAGRGQRGLGLDEWQLQASEDFAEVVAMIWSVGSYLPRTDTLAPAPDGEQLVGVAVLAAQP